MDKTFSGNFITSHSVNKRGVTYCPLDWIMHLNNYEEKIGKQHRISFSEQELEPKCNGRWHAYAYG